MFGWGKLEAPLSETGYVGWESGKLALPDFERQDLGDTSTLADPTVIDILKSTRRSSRLDARL